MTRNIHTYEIFDPHDGLMSEPEGIKANSPIMAAQIFAERHAMTGKAVRHLEKTGGCLLVRGRRGSYLYDFITNGNKK